MTVSNDILPNMLFSVFRAYVTNVVATHFLLYSLLVSLLPCSIFYTGYQTVYFILPYFYTLSQPFSHLIHSICIDISQSFGYMLSPIFLPSLFSYQCREISQSKARLAMMEEALSMISTASRNRQNVRDVLPPEYLAILEDAEVS